MDNLDEKILVIESDDVIAELIRKALTDAKYGPFNIECVSTLSASLKRIKKGGIKAILLDLFLSDSQGLATFEQLYLVAMNIPILILSEADKEDLAKSAIRIGAQDYFLKDHLDGYNLSHALRNVIARKLAEEELFIERERAQVTLNSIGDAVISTDITGHVAYLNVVAERMTGWLREAAAGKPLNEVLQIIDGITQQPARSPIELAIQENKVVGLCADSILIRRDGFETAIEDSAAPIHDRGGRVIGAVMVIHDVSEARTMMRKMSYLAQHDFLTDLPNRVLLKDRLMQAIASCRRHRHQKRLAVLFLDVDLFKNINDSLGHPMGDKLLQSVATRLMTCIRGADTVSRQGGDEFIVLLTEIERSGDIARCAENIISSLAKPYGIEKHDLNVTASIGISVYPDDGEDAETLIANADAAMYQAKQNGRNNFQFFRRDISNRLVERQTLEASLNNAESAQELVLYYQPKVNFETGKITGTEALIRWRHPQRGLLPPEQFVHIAEESGLIVPIGKWVLREACLQVRFWLDAGLAPNIMSINISAAEFRSKDFLAGVRNILQETQLTPSSLEFELTENVLMQDCEATNNVLEALKSIGVLLAIDDFGTGYSSLSYLKRFPIDTLKIDRSFVRDINVDMEDAAIVRAVIGMGSSLKKKVIAEGVETQEQFDFLRNEHCCEGQGYYFSRPVATEEYTQLLRTGISAPPRP